MIHSIRALIWCLAQLRSRIHFQTRQSLPSWGEDRRTEEGKLRGLRWWGGPVDRNHMTKNGERNRIRTFSLSRRQQPLLWERYGIFSIFKDQLFSNKLSRPSTVVFYGDGKQRNLSKDNQDNKLLQFEIFTFVICNRSHYIGQQYFFGLCICLQSTLGGKRDKCAAYQSYTVNSSL